MAKQEFKDPVFLKRAQDEFGHGRKWFKARMGDGRIRWRKIGRHVVLEGEDVARLALDPEEQTILNRASERPEKRAGE